MNVLEGRAPTCPRTSDETRSESLRDGALAAGAVNAEIRTVPVAGTVRDRV